MFSFLACKSNEGETNNVATTIGESRNFTKLEIQSAFNCVFEKFKEFEGCVLLRISYNEKLSNREFGKNDKNSIKVYSDFYVKQNGGDGSLEQDYTYKNWSWILVRNNETLNWKVKDWGYA